jgi:hypothetical protein
MTTNNTAEYSEYLRIYGLSEAKNFIEEKKRSLLYVLSRNSNFLFGVASSCLQMDPENRPSFNGLQDCFSVAYTKIIPEPEFKDFFTRMYPKSTRYDLNLNGSALKVLWKEVIGAGAMGRVVRGTLNGELVAVKLVSKQLGKTDVESTFIREATIACRCKHPNIIRTLGYLDNGDDMLMCMGIFFPLLNFFMNFAVFRSTHMTRTCFYVFARFSHFQFGHKKKSTPLE